MVVVLIQLVIVSWLTAVTLTFVVTSGAPVGPGLLSAGVLAAVAVALGVLRRAFDRQRRWAWWLLLVGGVVGSVVSVGTGQPWRVVLELVLLALLLHPDSRSWVADEPRSDAPVR